MCFNLLVKSLGHRLFLLPPIVGSPLLSFAPLGDVFALLSVISLGYMLVLLYLLFPIWMGALFIIIKFHQRL
jgi:hypothetical protein